MKNKTNFLACAALVGLSVLASGPVFAAGDAQPSESKPAAKRPGEQIYGYQLMTPEERTAYREKMRAAKTVEEREKLRDEHHQTMRARAKERGITLPDAPPSRSGAGRGPGMGPGPSMGPGAGMGPGPRSEPAPSGTK